jgi:peptidoglycan/xylan/chitin deacetylase (PgdA/CDA1 family)
MIKIKRFIKELIQFILTKRIVQYTCGKNGGVILSFDDGPNNVNTPMILDALKSKNTKAVFFMIGQEMKTHPEVVKRIIDEGHEVGMHSYYHNKIQESSISEVMQEVYKSIEVFNEFGIKSKYFRPVWGTMSLFQLIICVKNGISTVLWSLDSNDYKKNGTQSIIDNVVDNVKPGDIVLFHDDVSFTIEAIGVIIDKIRQRGIKFVGLSDGNL